MRTESIRVIRNSQRPAGFLAFHVECTSLGDFRQLIAGLALHERVRGKPGGAS